MSTIYRAAVHCDAQRSVHCHGLFTVAGEPHALAWLAETTLREKGWRHIPKYLERPRDICPACQEGLPPEPTS